MAITVGAELQMEIERLVSYEAYLLDEHRFDEWLELFTEDATYAVSTREAVPRTVDGSDALSATVLLFDEDRAFTTARVKRMSTKLAHAEQPASLTRHLITNVLVHGEKADGLLHASASFQVYQQRPDLAEQVFYGKREDGLRRVDGGWRIARREVVLDTSLLPRTISIFF